MNKEDVVHLYNKTLLNHEKRNEIMPLQADALPSEPPGKPL